MTVFSIQSAGAEVIRVFRTVVRAEQNATLDIVESITMDFEDAQRHGIERKIPVKYTRHNNTFRMYYDVISITNENGNKYPYKKRYRDGYLNLRIGDPAVMVTGKCVYKIHYTVRRGVNFFDGKPEVYWNATGNEWPFSIEKATAEFLAPPSVAVEDLKLVSFVGKTGSTSPAKTVINQQKVLFVADNLAQEQGLTFAVRLPKNSLNGPSDVLVTWWFLRDWWAAFAIPLLVFMERLSKYLQKGRDEDRGKAIAVEWHAPEGLSPAEVGIILDESCGSEDVTATILDLAARGYFRIIEIDTETAVIDKRAKDVPREYLFVRGPVDPSKEELRSYEKLLIKVLFGECESVDVAQIRLSKVRETLYRSIDVFVNNVNDEVTSQGYFTNNPKKIQDKHFAISVFFGILGAVCFSFDWSASWGYGLCLSAGIMAIFAWAMPAKTAKGSQKLRECKGFLRFVRSVEKQRLEVMLREDPQLFGRLLPYAMAMGVADKWVQRFGGLAIAPLDWYETKQIDGQYSSKYTFARSMQDSLSSFSGAISSAGSGGSGFSGGGSGGGGGGGGGGNW